MIKKNKIIVIVGPTSAGKTGAGVYLARKFKGEIISADSRQVYKYMDVGTGKDLNEYMVGATHCNASEQKRKNINIPYHLIDVVHPKTEFNVFKFKKAATKAINDVLKRGKLPIVVGGTGLYAQALVDGFDLQPGKPDKELRAELEKKTAGELLKLLDPEFVKGLNNSEKKNKRRLVRYIEKLDNSGQITGNRKGAKYDFLVIGIKYPREIVWKRIYKRLIERLEKEDMVGEVRGLHKKHKVSWRRLENFGLEYKYISLYLQNKLSYEDMVENLYIAIRQFAKRQMTWYRRWENQGRKIYWISNRKKQEKRIKEFLKKV